MDADVTEQRSDTGVNPSTEQAADAFMDSLGDSSALPVQRLGHLAEALLAATTVDGVLQRIVLAARYLVPGADLVSITLRSEDGHLYTPVETDGEAVELDKVQYDSGEGPCVDAAMPSGPAYAYSSDLASETTWPVFATQAAKHGYSSVLSTALLNNPEPSPFTGALNIYSRSRDGLDAVSRDTAFLLATYASLALAAAHTSGESDRALMKANTEAANLRKALDTRTVIGQATGILMARRHLSAHDAFEVLSRASQDHNVKLADLAQILATHPDSADRI
jgi:hypothetical protein